MLSICIPIFNYDVTNLVNELYQQAITSNIEFEILVADDCSTDILFVEKNRSISFLQNVKFFELPKNIGRSSIRNLLSEKAKYKQLLFLDCDTFPEKSIFIQNYLNNEIENGVVVGGIVYRNKLPGINYSLRWHYGHSRETISAQKRSTNPYSSFMTGNFMIAKSVFQQMQFDENIKGYGHEDTYFGLALEQNNIEIKHIENRVFHDGLESNGLFIEKTKQGIDNLLQIYLNDPSNSLFISKNRLLKTFVFLQKLKVTYFGALLFWIFEKRWITNISKKKPSIRTFDWFKLGYLCFIFLKRN